MKMLSDDDLNLKALNDDELARAWDLWFDLAQSTNASDPPYTHGVFVATSDYWGSPRTPSPGPTSASHVAPRSSGRPSHD
jgi:hypothetical protein